MNKKQAHDIHITLLDAENAGAFLPLLPPAARGWLDAPEGVAVGAVDGGISTAVGACAAHVEAGWLEIDWIWVEESARGNGAGWDLMMALIRSSADAGGIIGLSIRYAAESGENLTGFLERMNFGISDGFMNGFQEKMSVLRAHKLFAREPSDIDLVKPLKDVGAGLRADFSRSLETLPDGAGVELPVAWEQYDGDLSRLYIRDGAIHGLVLMRRPSEKSLELAWAYAHSGEPAAFASPLYAAAVASAAACPPDTEVTIIALTDASRNLAEKIIPGAAPVPVKYGVRYF